MNLRVLPLIAAAALAACSPSVEPEATDAGDGAEATNTVEPGDTTGPGDAADPGNASEPGNDAADADDASELSDDAADADDASEQSNATDPVNAPEPSDDASEAGNATDPKMLVGVIAAAAEARDYEALSTHMADAFSYSFGREPSREGALARYREQPVLLDKLVEVLGRDCAPKAVGAGHWFVCPAVAADEGESYYGWRAGFRQHDDGTWEWVWFIAGD